MARPIRPRECAGLNKVIAALGFQGIAETCGLTIQAVRLWERVPAEHLDALSVRLDGLMHPWEIAPHVFPTTGEKLSALVRRGEDNHDLQGESDA